MPRLPIGVLGIGVHLPPKIRRNTDWPASFAERFAERRHQDITTPDLEVPGADAIVREVIGKYESDVFRGSVERRVLDDGLEPSDMEVEAGKKALDAASVNPEDIDLLVVSSTVPDLIQPANQGLLHLRLGLRQSALVCAVNSACSSILPSLILAASHLTATGQRHAMLIQSAAFSRTLDYERPLSVNFGDGATAVIVGPVGGDRGILGWSWFNDGNFHKGACIAQPGGEPWHRGRGQQVLTSLDPEAGRGMVLRLGFLCGQATDAALADAKLDRDRVNFFAGHQPTAWFTELCMRSAKLNRARTATTFARTAGVGSANVALNLDEGVRTRKLHGGDVALLYSCGSGMNWGALALRWGS